MRKTPTATAAWLTAPRMYVQTCIPSHDSPSRNTKGGGVCLRGSAHIRQYHRVFLNPYYGYLAAPAFRAQAGALTRPRKRKRSEGEKRERIQFLGCILKSADLSGATSANIVDGLRVLPLCTSALTLNPIRLISSLFLHPPQSGTPFISSLTFWPDVMRDV